MNHDISMSRRAFLYQSAALGLVSGCATDPVPQNFTAQGEIRAYLMHLGWNMWADVPVTKWGPYTNSAETESVCARDHFRTDMNVWNRVTEQMAKDGYNMIIVDVAEALVYPSHPEIAVQGSWTPEQLQAELRRLRGLGLEPIPKLNFSTAHDIWLGEYSRMVSSPKYYEVCAELIRDVAEVFEHPRFLHLGYDEENVANQSKYSISILRQGDLWWHDLKWFAAQTEKAGMRPWIWSDYLWHHKRDFLAKMPRSVVQSNWYYGKDYSYGGPLKPGFECNRIDAYLEMEKAGFDQVPCGSNYSCDENFGLTVDFARKHISPQHLKGFLMAPWFFPHPIWEKKLMDACRIGREVFFKA